MIYLALKPVKKSGNKLYLSNDFFLESFFSNQSRVLLFTAPEICFGYELLKIVNWFLI